MIKYKSIILNNDIHIYNEYMIIEIIIDLNKYLLFHPKHEYQKIQGIQEILDYIKENIKPFMRSNEYCKIEAKLFRYIIGSN